VGKINRQQFADQMGGAYGTIDINHVSPELQATLDSAGIDHATLARIAGADGVISGKAEMNALFDLVDSVDVDGSRDSLDLGDADAPTASGALFDALRTEANLRMTCGSPDVRPAPPAAQPQSPSRMSAGALLQEYSEVTKRLAGGDYPGRADDEQRQAALEAEMNSRAAAGIEAKRGAGRIPDGDQWKPRAMQPGQFEVRTRMYAPFDQFGGFAYKEYEGDARGPTPNLRVTSRMTQATVIDTRGPDGARVVDDRAYSDMSRRYWGGDVYEEGLAHPRGRIDVSQDRSGGTQLTQDLSGSLPIYSECGIHLPAPDIDVHNDMHIERDGDVLTISGRMTGDRFPNGEVLLTDAKGQTLLLHTYQTEGGPTIGPVTRLPGGAPEYMGDYSVRILLDGDGNFAGVEDPMSGRVLSVKEWNDRQVVRSAAE
jgi:hypothetical protein